MKISAKVENSFDYHSVEVQTGNHRQVLNIPGKPSDYGSAVNGGELLMLALATCYCNDLYREARKQEIKLDKVTVEASGDFLKEGEAGQNIIYSAWIEGDISQAEFHRLKQHTDKVAEIQNTLRAKVDVKLTKQSDL